MHLFGSEPYLLLINFKVTFWGNQSKETKKAQFTVQIRMLCKFDIRPFDFLFLIISDFKKHERGKFRIY